MFSNSDVFLEAEQAEEMLMSKEEYTQKANQGELTGYHIAPWATKNSSVEGEKE